MKVVLSESQVLNILNEITSEQRMDFLLDKVSVGGINSLTPAERIELRRLSGEDVSSDEENAVNLSDKISNDDESEVYDDELELPDVIEFINDNFPDGITFNIGHASWEAFIDRETEGLESQLKISITDGDRLIDIYPFKNGENKLKIWSTERSPFGITTPNIPSSLGEMEHFMRSLVNIEIPKIITYVLKTS